MAYLKELTAVGCELDVKMRPFYSDASVFNGLERPEKETIVGYAAAETRAGMALRAAEGRVALRAC